MRQATPTRWITLGFFALAGLLVAPGAASAKVPKAETAGKPDLQNSKAPIIWVWHDDTGWHVRFSGGSPKEKIVVTGIINVAGGRATRIQPQMQGGNDSMNRIDGSRAFFKSEVNGEIEGVDFMVKDDLGAVYFEFFVNYAPIEARTVRLGKDAKPAPSISPSLHISLE